jgi:hypothetical protein
MTSSKTVMLESIKLEILKHYDLYRKINHRGQTLNKYGITKLLMPNENTL